MLSFPTVHAITDALFDAEATAAGVGWHSPPTLLAVRQQRTNPETPELVAAPLPVQPEQWLHHTAGLAGVLTDATAALRSPAALTEFASAPQRRIVAWALLYEDPITDTVTDGEHGGEIRVLDAVDVDGRLYRLTRLRNSGQVVVVVDDGPALDGDPPTRALLADLLDATRQPEIDHTAREG
jgi:hypothetical protein